ncbi:MAG: hypothetical protein DRO87_01645 [Candidatus Thorarchaeota archaeon]|nr:MAG: hypothetical protein DRO87_01645 [Candidatus Thorarchaeota archaeon]
MTDFQEYLHSLMRGDLHEAEHYLMDREAFTFPTAKPQWAPPRHYNIEHLRVEWKVDMENEHIDAVSYLTLRSIVSDLRNIFLHAAELSIESVTDPSGKRLEFTMHPDNQSMSVALSEGLKEGDSVTLRFTYSIDHPRAGVWFTRDCPEFPDMETSFWTQMQDDYARYCVPIYDNPSHKFPTETLLTVPKGFYAMSNGRLEERRENGNGTETFHWIQSLPIPAYLMTMAASEYVEYKEDLDGLEVSYYAHKRWDRDTVYRSFGKTPQMIRFFETKLGVKFSWDKYAQITAANFVIGGMENVSATTQTDATLHDEKAHLDYESDGLVAHELSHMWGGDLVTCRTWSHGWLNEGWATQMQNEWKRHDKGDEEYLYEQYGKQIAYFNEDKKKYRRPIVQNEWERGSDVFDRHLYPGAAWRYYMLKHLVGEEKWWAILGEWMKRYAYKSVYTHDLEALFTEMTGEDYGWFFEQWLYKAGYPECKIECSYDDKLGHVLVKVEQTQKHDDGMTPEVFRFPLVIEIVDGQGERSRYKMEVSERVHNFYLPIEEKPLQILVDPDYSVLMDWTIEKPEDMWIEQLRNGVHTVQKIKAAQALAKKATPKTVEALGRVLKEETFWGTQFEIAKVLGSIKTESALDQLLTAVDVKNTKARTAVANALGEFYQNDRAFDALEKLTRDEESYFVAAAAAHSLGKTKHERAFEVLSSLLKSAPPSWHDIVQVGCLQGLAATEREDVIPIAIQYSRVGVSDWIRRNTAGILAKLGKRFKKEHPEIKSILEKMFVDGSYRVQMSALYAAPDYEDASLIPSLSILAERAAESGVVRACRLAIRKLSKKKEPSEIESLRKSIEELQRENLDLKDRLSKIESRLDEK